jgi:glycolate oxidase FAD binding subunit
MQVLSDTIAPPVVVRDSADLLEVIRTAAAGKTRLDIRGLGSRLGLGRPVDADQVVSLEKLAGIVTYEPEELVMVAKAATPLKDILKALDKAGQMLAFDPPLGAGSHGKAKGTIGGVIATNASGPRRITAGAARDYLLGFNAVSGRGERFKSGSRVMKNVTGYDLSKLMAGSFGTLAVMDEITLKTMPKPEDAATILVDARDEIAAGNIISKAFDSPHEPATGAIIPSALTAFSSSRSLKKYSGAGMIVAIRLEGFSASVKSRVSALKKLLSALGEVSHMGKSSADALHASLREVSLLPRQDNRTIWKMSCPPAESGRVLAELAKRPQTRAYADWGGGLIWLSQPVGYDIEAKGLRGILASCGGHVTLVSAPEDMRSSVDVFEPQPDQLFELTRRVKSGFDPLGILNPGRMYEDI